MLTIHCKPECRCKTPRPNIPTHYRVTTKFEKRRSYHTVLVLKISVTRHIYDTHSQKANIRSSNVALCSKVVEKIKINERVKLSFLYNK